jgi:hypothetical protein
MLAAVGYGAVLIDAGGARPLIEAVSNHGTYHFGELAKADLPFDESGIARAFLLPWAGLVWISLAMLGAGFAWARASEFAGFRPLIVLVVLPFIFLVYGVSWAGNVRYALPLLALGWGLAMVGLARMAGKWSLPLAALFLIGLAVPMTPELEAYRTIASPPIQALEHSLAVARQSGAVIVTDRTLASFFDYEELRHGIPGTVLHDSQIGVDAPPPPEWLTVAVFDNSSDRFVGRAGRTRTFDCQQRWLRRLSQGRFLNITVAEDATVLGIDSRNSALK